jgi:hypothetical protein
LLPLAATPERPAADAASFGCLFAAVGELALLTRSGRPVCSEADAQRERPRSRKPPTEKVSIGGMEPMPRAYPGRPEIPEKQSEG